MTAVALIGGRPGLGSAIAEWAGRSVSALVLTILTAAVLAGCTSASDQPSPRRSGAAGPSAQQGGAASSTAEVTAVASGLDAPWSITFAGETALLSERDSGRILELTGGGAVREVGTITGVAPHGEGGLLGIAVHERNLYTYFTAAGGNRVERYELTGEAGSIGLGEPVTILEDLPSARFHHGGRIAFGPDGMLYATIGDAGSSWAAQDLGSPAGKILRLTPNGDVPEDNPFDGSPVFSYGHRNPQGLAWDEDGTMYASEFGQDTRDELNVIEAGSNYGWPEVEGIAEEDRYIDPVQQWAPADASPSGIAIADGSIWIANLRGERLREVPLADLASSTEHLVGEHGRLRDVVIAPDGSLRVLTNNTDGRGDPGPDDDRVLQVDPTP